MKKLRVYVDTSVFGGCFDPEYMRDSVLFFKEALRGRYKVVISRRTLMELDRAPVEVQKVLAELPTSSVELVDDPVEIGKMSQAYIDAGVLSMKHKADAEHIAAASVSDADLLLSWNFKHMVHFDKIKGYQSVNLMNGYRAIDIYSPKEVVDQP